MISEGNAYWKEDRSAKAWYLVFFSWKIDPFKSCTIIMTFNKCSLLKMTSFEMYIF